MNIIIVNSLFCLFILIIYALFAVTLVGLRPVIDPGPYQMKGKLSIVEYI